MYVYIYIHIYIYTCTLYKSGLPGERHAGAELDPETECQLTPKRVDALSDDRVVGVALGYGFTLAVTDAGAVFSFGQSGTGAWRA